MSPLVQVPFGEGGLLTVHRTGPEEMSTLYITFQVSQLPTGSPTTRWASCLPLQCQATSCSPESPDQPADLTNCRTQDESLEVNEGWSTNVTQVPFLQRFLYTSEAPAEVVAQFTELAGGNGPLVKVHLRVTACQPEIVSPSFPGGSRGRDSVA